MLKYTQQLQSCLLQRRYKRFIADVTLDDNGEEVIAHCPNSGRMTGCVGENWPAVVSESDNPKRKLKYTLEMTHNGTTWIVTNTNKANELACEGIEAGLVEELFGYESYTREVKYGKNSRIDILAESGDKKCYIEVKSVTMINELGQYCFPDSPTVRGQKHLCELVDMVKEGHRAVMFYMVLREDGSGFTPAADIDPKYAELLKWAVGEGVEVFVYQGIVSPTELSMGSRISPVVI